MSRLGTADSTYENIITSSVILNTHRESQTKSLPFQDFYQELNPDRHSTISKKLCAANLKLYFQQILAEKSGAGVHI